MSDVNLPPLPPTGGEIPGRSIVDVVAAQHRELLRLTERLTESPEDRDVASVLVATLSRHLCAEEQYLYPAVRTAVPGGEQLADRELAEDQAILERLRDLERTGDGRDGLAEAVRRHVAADAEELLPLLEQMVPAEDLVRLGNRFETAEEAAPTRPHPSTPSTPPWNKVVDPLVGVADKIRDVIGSRATYARDL
ncbi:hemerythrin domain-containing protein [Actinoplanes xinjiangensis]|uniref:Hemerythrin HHE cation binding domain-containing protein n=1 Tax=Actinoplanes xinjiangensis TaxID=512350 RepID=A0A316FVQ6_9ACTN|nr:hemerythrin domain-containing protein [Actinoplanes xinjiangensis]PWK52402.1 hemerythrin HHE cation binding domain-containing protein [Actinoplanes xinjiangensis]GIF36898.1 hemerythrin [Actinoplanes xinjiangensis]